MDDVKKRFLTNTDETGRFIVKSLTTGKTYYVEPIGNGHPADWGDINPATKKIEGDYGQKYTGCPLSAIYQRDLEYEKLMNKANEVQG